MKKGILAFIFTLIVFMAAVGFGKNLQTTEQALSYAEPIETVQTMTTSPVGIRTVISHCPRHLSQL